MVVLVSCAPMTGLAQRDWASEYARLDKMVEEHADEPTGSPLQVEPYLLWMDTKARERDEVNAALQEVNRLSVQNPEDEGLAAWTQKFFELGQRAQDSGDNTAWTGASVLLYCNAESFNNTWEVCIWTLETKGRPLLLKAQETGFATDEITRRARCMVRFSTTNIEFGHVGIWSGRDGFTGSYDDEGSQVQPDEFDVACSPRSEGTVTAEGEPLFPLDEAFEKTGKIRDEAEWWQLTAERQDVIDLENDYYEDALCEQPPHKRKMGHDWARQVAEERGLDKSVEYNKGFYGTLYGLVEVALPDGRQPAAGATVTVSSGGETWTATAGADGSYEIEKAILHDDCSPHDISATYRGDRVDDTYNGPLADPDPGARHRKDLLIIPRTRWAWTGSLTLGTSKELHCTASKEDGGSRRSFSRQESHVQRATLQVYAENVRETPEGFDMRSGDNLSVSGSLDARINQKRETTSHSKARNGYSFEERRSVWGSDACALDEEHVIVHITRAMPDIGDAMQELTRALADGQPDPATIEQLQKKMEEMTRPKDPSSFDVTVMVQMMGDSIGQVQYSDYRRSTNSGRSRVERDDKGRQPMPMVLPLMVSMEGTFTKNKDGSAQITASVEQTETSPAGGVWECPDAVSRVSGTLHLSRQPTNRKHD